MPEIGRADGDRYIEDDLKLLQDIDGRINELLMERAERVQMIKIQHDRNFTRIQGHDDWFDGEVKGRPIPDRGAEVADFNPNSYDRRTL